MSEYPEHEKLSAISDQSQACHDFISWLEETKGWSLCYIPDDLEHSYCPAPYNARRELAEFFKIDSSKIEAEKRAMLEEMRKANS